MLFWMERRGVGAETLRGLGDMSKADILRGIVAEKLTTAAQEILAVVERTVAGYEEEAAGLRREVERQKRQLELLQPRVHLERRAVIPEVEQRHTVVVDEDDENSGVDEDGSLGLLWFNSDCEDDDVGAGDEEHEPSDRPQQEDLKDPDFQIKPRVQSDRRRTSRTQISDSHLGLRICVLEDSQTDLLSKHICQRSPIQEVRCLRTLQEADFVDLLRSTFPQLADGRQFEFFTSDRSRKLKPLGVKLLTPEEIHQRIRLTGAGHSALYVRLKTGKESHRISEDLNPPQEPEDPPSSSATVLHDQTFLSPVGSSEKRRRGRPRLGEEPDHHLLRVCVLEDSSSDVLQKDVLMKSSVRELLIPRGLQENDFLNLLRSTFPQLAGDDRRLVLFKSDRSRKLQRLGHDEIQRTMRSAGKTLLYIGSRVSSNGEDEEEDDDSLAMPTMVIERMKGRDSKSDTEPPEGRRAGDSEQEMAVEEADDEDRQVDSSDEDWKPDPEHQRRWRKQVAVSDVRKAACKVCGIWYRLQGSLIKHSWAHTHEKTPVCGVCGQNFDSVEELKVHLKSYQKTHDCSECGKSFLSITGLNSHSALHGGNRPYKCDICKKSFAYLSSLSVHRWVHVADKPHRCDSCPKTFGLRAQLVAHRKLHSGREKHQCNVCGKLLYDLRSLTRHKATHSGERRYGCQVCGKRFKLAGALKSHEKIHTTRERRFLCHVCCKTFLSCTALTNHVKTHSGERPFVCATCGKGFISNGQLKDHLRVHTGEAPYGCSECGRYFKRRTHLTNHVKSHLGIKQFVCGVCGKACSRQEHLTIHMRTHNGERPYCCTVCERTFTQSHCLKTHMKSHQGETEGP